MKLLLTVGFSLACAACGSDRPAVATHNRAKEWITYQVRHVGSGSQFETTLVILWSGDWERNGFSKPEKGRLTAEEVRWLRTALANRSLGAEAPETKCAAAAVSIVTFRYSSNTEKWSYPCGPMPSPHLERVVLAIRKSTERADAMLAVAAARRCVAAHPQLNPSVWRSPLALDQATAEPHFRGPNSYVVTIPEQDPQGLPAGIDLFVELPNGECSPAPMD